MRILVWLSVFFFSVTLAGPAHSIEAGKTNLDDLLLKSAEGYLKGEIIPLTESISGEDEGGKTVTATGSAAIIRGNMRRARKEALLDAYRYAVSTMVGVEIQSLTVVKDCEKFTSLVVEKSRGYIKSYRILSEDVDEGSNTYTIVIEVSVAEGSMLQNKDELALKAYLEVIDNPTVLILLSDKGGLPSRLVPDAVAPGETELSLAKIFKDAGYTVLTADDLPIGDLSGGSLDDWLKQRDGKEPAHRAAIEESELLQARKGYTAAARKVGEKAGADLVICGFVKVVSKTREKDEKNKEESVELHVSFYLKTVVCSTGQVLDLAINRLTGGQEEDPSEKLMQTVGKELIWQIPQWLSRSEKVFKLAVTNCSLEHAGAIEKVLNGWNDLENASMSAWSPDKDKKERGTAVFTIRTGFLGPGAERLCEYVTGKVDFGLLTVRTGKFAAELQAEK